MIKIKTLQELESFIQDECYSLSTRFEVYKKATEPYFGKTTSICFCGADGEKFKTDIDDKDGKLLKQMLDSVRNLINPDPNYSDKIWLVFRK